MYNQNCDGSGPHAAGQVRLLPMGGGGNGILCKKCFYKEIAYRKDRNKDLGEFAKFDLPTWESLEIYGE